MVRTMIRGALEVLIRARITPNPEPCMSNCRYSASASVKRSQIISGSGEPATTSPLTALPLPPAKFSPLRVPAGPGSTRLKIPQASDVLSRKARFAARRVLHQYCGLLPSHEMPRPEIASLDAGLSPSPARFQLRPPHPICLGHSTAPHPVCDLPVGRSREKFLPVRRRCCYRCRHSRRQPPPVRIIGVPPPANPPPQTRAVALARSTVDRLAQRWFASLSWVVLRWMCSKILTRGRQPSERRSGRSRAVSRPAA